MTIGRVGDKQVNAASMLSVLALGVKHGEEIEIVVGDAPNADEVLATIADVISTNHDEDSTS